MSLQPAFIWGLLIGGLVGVVLERVVGRPVDRFFVDPLTRAWASDQDRSGAWKAAQRGLKKRSAAAADQYRSAALAELTMVQNAAWGRAMNGDVKAGTLVVRTVEQKCRLLGA